VAQKKASVLLVSVGGVITMSSSSTQSYADFERVSNPSHK
jgi:hypothetical protein